ncbi:KleE protein [Shigella sonnei]|uniref:KleE protein n=2 Tax=Enterobacteriaceae TaxID=543 RepID=A0A7Z1D2M5_SHISO|nr:MULTISPECIES: KleE stable inheritance protein [Enterobacteriaceae]EBF6611888.1 KleE protein [Salmonella enterica subsp. enterica serovar Typhimurium]EBH8645627.1 KleE protein [Salmonella enterica subsp. enterica serovar 4,[5],12:i:-]HBY3820200.1 KleE protein [Klebsiella pneumoniae]EFG3021965.1 KleE protein [Escherichia coli]OYE50272.1 KleE protein [Shigella sonnei]
MTNVVKFPRQEGSKPQQIRAVEDVAGPASENTVRNILYGVIGAVYMVLVILWIPVRFLLIANVVIQFFKMLFKWSDGPFAASWPFVTSFLVLATLTYIMATWKPKLS